MIIRAETRLLGAVRRFAAAFRWLGLLPLFMWSPVPRQGDASRGAIRGRSAKAAGLCRAVCGCGLLVALACTPVMGAALDPDELLYDEALAAADAGEVERARAMLEALVRRQPMHAGAWVDLALLNCRLGDRERGRRILRRIVAEFDPPPAIRELIARIESQPCATLPLPRWRAGLAVGYDNNVNLGASRDRVTLVSDVGVVEVLLAEGMQPRADAFTEAWLEGNWREVPGQPRASLALRRHAHESAFDLAVLALEGGHSWPGERVDTIVQARWTHTRLDDQGFLDALTLQARMSGHPIWHGTHPVAEARATYNRFADYPAFDSRVWEARLGLAKAHGPLFARATALLSLDQALDQRPGDNRAGFGAELTGEWPVSRRLHASGLLRVQRIRDDAAYFEPLFPLRREQTLWQGRLELSMPLRHDLVWNMGWTGQRSTNNLGFLDHHTNTIQTGLTLAF